MFGPAEDELKDSGAVMMSIVTARTALAGMLDSIVFQQRRRNGVSKYPLTLYWRGGDGGLDRDKRLSVRLTRDTDYAIRTVELIRMDSYVT